MSGIGRQDPDADPEGFWQARYAEATATGRVWSEEPNPTLVAEAGALPPGAALDVGCGEGADAVWLAAHGWRVTAADVAPAALERGAAAARPAGEEVAERIEWVRHDLRTWEPPAEAFDLVTAHFVHVTHEERPGMLERWASAVAPGGTLLVVAHSPLDLETALRRPPDPQLYACAQEMADLLGGALDVVAACDHPRAVTGPGGEEVVAHDAVLRAVRRSAPHDRGSGPSSTV